MTKGIERTYIRVYGHPVNVETRVKLYPLSRNPGLTDEMIWSVICSKEKSMPSKSPWGDLELFLVGLIMAGTLYCDGPQIEDPTEDFDLWRASWDAAVPAWNSCTRNQGWYAVGMSWEYHAWDW